MSQPTSLSHSLQKAFEGDFTLLPYHIMGGGGRVDLLLLRKGKSVGRNQCGNLSKGKGLGRLYNGG